MIIQNMLLFPQNVLPLTTLGIAMSFEPKGIFHFNIIQVHLAANSVPVSAALITFMRCILTSHHTRCFVMVLGSTVLLDILCNQLVSKPC